MVQMGSGVMWERNKEPDENKTKMKDAWRRDFGTYDFEMLVQQMYVYNNKGQQNTYDMKKLPEVTTH